MENLELTLKPLVQDSDSGKFFYKINLSHIIESKSKDGSIIMRDVEPLYVDKYYAFCYVGYPSIMDSINYQGEKYKECVLYLKKKIGNKKYQTIHEICFKIDFYDIVSSYMRKNLYQTFIGKINAQERKDKIEKLLGN